MDHVVFDVSLKEGFVFLVMGGWAFLVCPSDQCRYAMDLRQARRGSFRSSSCLLGKT